MGFTHWSRFMRDSDRNNNDPTQPPPPPQDLDWTDTPKKPWVIVDWNNFVMTMGRNPAVATCVLTRVELICKALATSGARLCVVVDGKYHTSERTAIKLGRIAVRVRASSASADANPVDGVSRPATSYDFNAVFVVAERALRSALPPATSDLSAASDGATTFIWAIADGEADGTIRHFIRNNQPEGPVLLMSADASLAVGVPATNLSIIDMRSLALVQREVVGRSLVLVGKVHAMCNLLDRLAIASNAAFGFGSNNNGNLVTGWERMSQLLPWVACILDGERSQARSRQPEDPFQLLAYLKAFLVHNRRDTPNPLRDAKVMHWQLVDLYVATVAVNAWWSQQSPPPISFTSFVGAVRTHAAPIADADAQQQSARARPLFAFLRAWPTLGPAWVAKNFHLKYPAENLMRHFDGSAIAREVDRRMRDLRDEPPAPQVRHHTRWCKLAECEPVDVCVEALLRPLVSLSRQVYCLRRRPLDGGSGGDQGGQGEEMDAALAALDADAVTVDAFHVFLRVLVPLDPEAAVNLVTVDTAKIDPTAAARVPAEQHFTMATLIGTSPAPARGLLLPAPGALDQGLLYFRSCDPTDPLDVQGAYCTHPATTPAAVGGQGLLQKGPLFDLRHRAAFLMEVATNRWASRDAPGAVPDTADRVSAMLLRALGLAGDDGACSAAAACWGVLPAPVQRATAVANSVGGPARVAVATHAAFAALAGPWLASVTHATSGHALDGVVRAAATALLLSPFYATPRFATSATYFEGDDRPARVDVLAPQARFEDEMAALSKRLVAPGATRRADQLASVLELVYEQMQGLLEDAESLLGRSGGGGGGGGDRGVGHCVWLDLCRWFALGGVQHSLGGFPETDCDVGDAYARACAAAGVAADDAFLDALNAAVDALTTLPVAN